MEDNPADTALTRLTRHLLTESLGPGTRTFCAERLSAALSDLEHETFDVVILDLQLPDTDGLDGLRKIACSVPGVPVVVLTGVADEVVQTEALVEGVQEVLKKGIGSKTLGRAIERAISRNRADAGLLRLGGALTLPPAVPLV